MILITWLRTKFWAKFFELEFKRIYAIGLEKFPEAYVMKTQLMYINLCQRGWSMSQPGMEYTLNNWKRLWQDGQHRHNETD